MDSKFVFKDRDLAKSLSYARGCTVIEAEEFVAAFKNVLEEILLKGGKVILKGDFTLQVIDMRNGMYRLKLKISEKLRQRIKKNSSEVAYEKRRLSGNTGSGKEFLQNK